MCKTHALCPVCSCEVGGESKIDCPACGVPHHKDCWGYNGKCGIYACNGGSDMVLVRRSQRSLPIHSFQPRRQTSAREAAIGLIFLLMLGCFGLTMLVERTTYRKTYEQMYQSRYYTDKSPINPLMHILFTGW